MTPDARIADLEAVVAQQREQIATLLERLRESDPRRGGGSADDYGS